MRVLFVTPISEGSGETVTATHMGADLSRKGHDVAFLASGFARKFIEPVLPGVTTELGVDGSINLDLWRRIIGDFRPDVVVFADYPLMFFPEGVSPMASEPGWQAELNEYDGCLITLDHFGFAQREMGMFFGPAHLTPFQYHRFQAIPERMQILLPCPMHEPRDVSGRRGYPFRYWEAPLAISPETRAGARRRHLVSEDEKLVFHTVPNWAWQAAEMMQLPLYRYLPELLDRYFGDLPFPVTIVSVNNGDLLDPEGAPRVRIINLPPVPVSEFEALLLGSDLMITENRISISLGKAVCGYQFCAALVNRQSTVDLISSTDSTVRRVVAAMEGRRLASVYPFEVFPSGMTDLLREIILYKDNSLTNAFCDLEIFGGECTANQLRRLLMDHKLRADLRKRQEFYVANLNRLPAPDEVIAEVSAALRA